MALKKKENKQLIPNLVDYENTVEAKHHGMVTGILNLYFSKGSNFHKHTICWKPSLCL